MKKGKIILSAAAFFVTAAGALAMKAHGKFKANNHIYATVVSGGVHVCTKLTCTTTSGTTDATPACLTNTSKSASVPKAGHAHFAQTNGQSNHLCETPTVNWTHAF